MMWALNVGAPIEVIDYNSHFTNVFKQKQKEFTMETSLPIMISGDNQDFDSLCKQAAENIHLLKEAELLDKIPTISDEIVNAYIKIPIWSSLAKIRRQSHSHLGSGAKEVRISMS